MIIGDFNDYLSANEKCGGYFCEARCLRFSNNLDRCGLLDLGASGPKFTWHGQRSGASQIKVRLDRALANMAWRVKFADARVQVLPRTHSDHNPLLLLTDAPLLDRSLRPFRAEAAWLSHRDFKDFFAGTWLPYQHSLTKALSNFRVKVQVWNKEVFGHITQRKKSLLARISGIQRIMVPREELRVLEADLLSQLNEVLMQEEILWRQKSRLQWVMNGDRNTKFYHASTLIRRHRNRIDSLKINNAWCSDHEVLKCYVSNFFKDMYCAGVDCSYADSFPPPKVQLSADMITSLSSPVSSAEIKFVLDCMGGLKAPGPDGVPACFYQQNWSVVGPTICSFVHSVFASGCFPENMNESYISLAPKVDSPEVVQQLRPIALANVAYKLVKKI